jgi:adenosylhomocysteine nucleosidase
MVRGISDYADGRKAATDGAGWQSRAASNAAAFSTALASMLATGLNTGRKPAPGSANSAPFNLATGNAKVGFQGTDVTIHGGFHMDGPDLGSGTAQTGKP